MPKGGPRLRDDEGEDGEEALDDTRALRAAAHNGLGQLLLAEQEEEGLHRVLHVGCPHLALQHVEDNVEEVEHLLAHLGGMENLFRLRFGD